MFILSNVKRLAKTRRAAAINSEAILTYTELEARSNAMAAFLLQHYPGKAPVILWGDKENDMLTGVIAALKAGKPYVMVPSYFPQPYVETIVKNCAPCIVLNVSNTVFTGEGCAIIEKATVDAICTQYAGIDVSENCCVGPGDTVCLFYTSGSTGVPKAVAITRRNIEAMTAWWGPLHQLGIESPRILNFISYGFSASLLTIYSGIGILGGTLYALGRNLLQNYSRMVESIIEADPHYIICTPSFLEICLTDARVSSEKLPSLRQMLVGGESLPRRMAKSLLERFPIAQIMSCYGMTETTTGTITCQITWEMVESDKPLPIGYTSSNSRIRIIDEAGNSLSDGHIGELVIVSDMVANGYYKDLERTSKAFFTDADGTRGFYTRDLVWMENSLLYFVGRVDNMVKVGGYRVEMEEVEHYLSKVSAVDKCAVAPVIRDRRVVMLVAYVVLKTGTSKDIRTTVSIKKELSQRIQSYMIPQKLVYLDNLPQNLNGKIDRRLLQDMSKIG